MQIRTFDGEAIPRLKAVVTAHWKRIADRDARLPGVVDPEPILSLLARGMEDAHSIGFFTERDGEPTAFMIAHPTNLEPDSLMANFHPLRYARILFMIGKMERVFTTLFRLYAEVSNHLYHARYRIHQSNVFAVDNAVLDLWSELGFGRLAAYASARLIDLPTETTSIEAVEIRRASQMDSSIIRNFWKTLSEWHRQSPTFHPVREAAMATFYIHLEAELQDQHHGVFIAERHGIPVGVCDGFWLEEPPSGLKPLVRSPYAYLRIGVVEPHAHGKGIGLALCTTFYNWLRSVCNPPYVYLNYVTGNIAGRNFWMGQGYRPISYEIQRVIPVA